MDNPETQIAEPFEFTLARMLREPDACLEFLIQLIETARNNQPTTADQFCECSRFNLIERVKIAITMKPTVSTKKLAYNLAEEIFQNLQQKFERN